MKKKIKDLTKEEIITICDRYIYCGDCKLRFHGGDYCIRKYIPKEVFPEDVLERYFNREVDLPEPTEEQIKFWNKREGNIFRKENTK